MTWKQIHDRIETMSEEEQNEEGCFYDDNEGMWCPIGYFEIMEKFKGYRGFDEDQKYTLVG